MASPLPPTSCRRIGKKDSWINKWRPLRLVAVLERRIRGWSNGAPSFLSTKKHQNGLIESSKIKLILDDSMSPSLGKDPGIEEKDLTS